MGWVGSRWLSPKASTGVAGGERVCMWWGWEEGVCVCVCACQRCVCARVCVFCLEGWMEGHQCRRTSSGHGERNEEEEQRQTGRRDGGGDESNADGRREALPVFTWVAFILKIIT